MIARMGDIGQGWCSICECGMLGQILMGSNNVLTNNKPTSKMNDLVQGSCGHIGVLIATTKNLVNGATIASIGSQFHGVFSGSIITASSNVINIGSNSVLSNNQLITQSGVTNSSAFGSDGLYSTGVS